MRKNTVGDFIKNHFPQSASVGWLMLIGPAFLIGGSADFFFYTQFSFLFIVLQAIGISCVGIFFLVVLLEIIAKFSGIALSGLRYLIKVIKTVSDIYSLIIKFLIKKPVLLILEEKENSEPEDMIFYSEDGSWKLSNRVIKVDTIKYLKLVVRPSKSSLHWRIGFKFSSNEVFPLASHAKEYPLLHLTRNDGENKLRLDYYDELMEHNTVALLDNYDNEEITIKVFLNKKAKDYGVRVNIFNKNMKEIYENGFALKYHKYFMLGTWGDGNKYEFDVRQYIVK